MLLSSWEVARTGSTQRFLCASGKLSEGRPGTCRPQGSAQSLFLATRTGTGRAFAHGVRISWSFESESSPATVLLCY